jgi:hypothetical protein
MSDEVGVFLGLDADKTGLLALVPALNTGSGIARTSRPSPDCWNVTDLARRRVNVLVACLASRHVPSASGPMPRSTFTPARHLFPAPRGSLDHEQGRVDPT